MARSPELWQQKCQMPSVVDKHKHGGLRLQTRQNDYEKSVFRELHSSLRTSVLVSKEVAVTTVEMKINRLISLGQQSSPSALLDRLIL